MRDKAVLWFSSDPVTRAKGPEHIGAYNWMQEYAAGVIAERRKNPRNDLISHFSAAEIDGDRLTSGRFYSTTTTLIMAGIESLGGYMAMLALQPLDLHRCAGRRGRRSPPFPTPSRNRSASIPPPNASAATCKRDVSCMARS